MISEKTVELNLTTEFINWLSHQKSTPYFAVGPTQAQEAKFGFDVGVFGNASGALIQYKRAYVKGAVWEWRLNYTTARDQLYRLQQLEAAGHAVYYAFPYFHTIKEIQKQRRRLLLRTFWFKPSQINPVGGPNGHHEVRFDSVSKKWSVHSEEGTALPEPLNLSDVINGIESPENQISSLVKDFNMIFSADNQQLTQGESDAESSPLSGTCIVGRGDA